MDLKKPETFTVKQGGESTCDAGKKGKGPGMTVDFMKDDNALTVVSNGPNGSKKSGEIDRLAKDNRLYA